MSIFGSILSTEVWPRSNPSGLAPPGVNDDSGDGYAPGSVWVDTTVEHCYICTDASAGAAGWETLGEGALLEAVVLAPAAATRNLIQPTADVPNLILKAKSGQTANLQSWRDSSDNVNSYVHPTGVGVFRVRTAVTNSRAVALVVGHNSTGTPADNFAVEQTFVLESSTTENREAARIAVDWSTANDATRKPRMYIQLQDFNADRLLISMRADGSVGQIGFLGAPAVSRPAQYTLSGSLTRVFPTDPTVAYTGAADGEAKLADLNTLRTVVSTLIGVVRQIVRDLGDTAGFGLLDD